VSALQSFMMLGAVILFLVNIVTLAYYLMTYNQAWVIIISTASCMILARMLRIWN
jgi:hypothetical protein